MRRAVYFLLITTILFTGCSNEKIKTDEISGNQWKLISVLPYNSRSVMYYNFNQLQKSGYWPQLRKVISDFDDSKSWIEDFKDNPKIINGGNLTETITALTGQNKTVVGMLFVHNSNEIINYLDNNPGFRKRIFKGKEIFSRKNKPLREFLLFNSSVLIATNDSMYLDSLISGNGKSLKDNNYFTSLIKEIKSKKYFWLVSDKGESAEKLARRITGANTYLPAAKLLKAIKRLSLAADFSGGLTIESTLWCDGISNAYLIAVGIKSYLAMDILSDTNYDLNQTLKQLKINREKEKIILDLDISNEQLAGLINLAKKEYTSKKL